MKINNVVVVSDIHAGCKLALFPPTFKLDEGGTYQASALQLKLWDMWNIFWNEWIPETTHGEPYIVVVNGDLIDGVHHNSNSQITHNLKDQRKIAKEILKPIYEKCEGRFYIIRGTPVHGGESGQDEEEIAQDLGAIPDGEGNYARYEMWLRIGKGLAHFTHHIGTTGSANYETTALMKEYAESCAEAGRWERQAPNVVVRSHRHRHSEIRVPTQLGYGICFTTAGWQLKTPFTYKIPGGRITTPQIGGSLIRMGDQDLYTRHKTWNVERSKEVVI